MSEEGEGATLWLGALFRMETERLESSLWVGSKRYRAVLTGWHFNWTEVDKKNRDKKTSRWPRVYFLTHDISYNMTDTRILFEHKQHETFTVLSFSTANLFGWFKTENGIERGTSAVAA